MHIRVRVVLRIGGVGQHVIHQLAVVEDCPEGVAAAAVENDLHGGLGDLGENGGAVAGGVCLAFVAADLSHDEKWAWGGGGLEYTPLTGKIEAPLSEKPVRA